MPAGRPPFEWTADVSTEILRRVMGGEAVSTICGPERDDWLPSETTFYKKLAEDAGLAEDYTRAKEVQAHREVDEIKSIADASTPETYMVDRLRVDVRKWRSARMAPKKYGDKLELSGDPERPVAIQGINLVGIRPDAES